VLLPMMKAPPETATMSSLAVSFDAFEAACAERRALTKAVLPRPSENKVDMYKNDIKIKTLQTLQTLPQLGPHSARAPTSDHRLWPILLTRALNSQSKSLFSSERDTRSIQLLDFIGKDFVHHAGGILWIGKCD